MTKTVRDNFDGQEVDEDESWEVQFINRNDSRGLIKIEADISNDGFMKLFGGMVKKPKYQIWVRATKSEREGNPEAKGHWEKLENREQ